jgi:large subunit ribosomal protein L29
MQHATGQEAKSHLIREARRNVARIKTVIAEKERA